MNYEFYIHDLESREAEMCRLYRNTPELTLEPAKFVGVPVTLDGKVVGTITEAKEVDGTVYATITLSKSV